MKHHRLGGSEAELAMVVRFCPQPVRKSQCTHVVCILFRTLGWKQIRYFPSCSYLVLLSLPKEGKGYVGFRIYWSNPCRFHSCQAHQIE